MRASMIRGPLVASLALLVGACGTSDDRGEAVADQNGQAVQDYEDLDSDALEAIVARTAEPVQKATVRYHLAVNLIEQANAWTTLGEERERLRERARQVIAGLSDGVAEEEFPETRFATDGTMLTGTFADVEAELLFRLDHATAGGTLPEAGGKRLDGEREGLSAYAGKVVLVDVWATWCAPCIQALPKLRELHGELPAARFALLSISVDDELETVTDFMRDEPMPWSNWHVGLASDVAQAWNVRAFPTYILVDPQGTILAHTNRLDEWLIELAKESVAAAPGAQASRLQAAAFPGSVRGAGPVPMPPSCPRRCCSPGRRRRCG